MHTTNYYDSFIEVAEDCPISTAEIPQPKNDQETVASLEYKMLIHNPYQYTSDDVLFGVYAQRNGLKETDEERGKFFSKGQPCFRASPLTKRYGWGVHSDSQASIAIYGIESSEYKSFVKDDNITQLKAMRNSRAQK